MTHSLERAAKAQKGEDYNACHTIAARTLMKQAQQASPPGSDSLLSSTDHSRDSARMTYVYPVVSRRAGGVSVGINLNPNNACNWHCIYCQVPELTRGAAPPIDLVQLEKELRFLLDDLVRGDFMQRRVPEGARTIEDIAFSGNGEPTSAREFPEAVLIAQRLRDEFQLPARLRLITNGSLIDRPAVQAGLSHLAAAHGEVWFKLDAGTHDGIQRINGVDIDPEGIIRRLQRCASICPTWVQTCCFSLDGQAPEEAEIAAWLNLLKRSMEPERENASHPRLLGVHIYGLARPSLQAEASRLGCLPADWLEKLAQRVRQLGLNAHVSP